VLWFHALSVGESLALRPLVDRALANDEAATVVLTTSTITSVAALEKAGLPDRAVHVLLPIDTVQAVRRFLDHWRPTVAVFAELDFRPRLMFETHRRHIHPDDPCEQSNVCRKFCKPWQTSRHDAR
jgi:3-deoxy-D-manno-octulosonic-acid transferase